MSNAWYGTMFGTTTVELHREFKTKFEDDMVDIHRDDSEKPKVYCDNRVITSKYNMFTFLPRSLFEQFRRVANLYFLFISILMLIGTYTTLYDSPITPYSTLITLVIVLTISMTKEAIEDTKRHKADKQTNHQTTLVLNKYSQSEEWTETKWKDVKVGNIVKVMKNQEIPADLVLLTTSEKMGVAFIETSNIDGETNLKIKNSCRTGAGVDNGPLWNVASELRNSNLTVQCEQPNSAIHHFNGTLFFSGREVGVDASSLLLRGSSLRNTKHAIGIVVYTGKETKLVMNSRKAPSKLSYIEKTMNTLIYMIFAAQVLISLVSLIAFIVFKNLYYDELTYLCYNSSGSTNSLLVSACDSSSDYSDAGYFITFFILYNNFIPISLYVTVEMCNYFQAFFIDNDLQLYDVASDTPALARTSNMNSDLGMVEYIFSDKTGTLTDNVMKFKRCSIAGVVYGDSPFDEEKLSPSDTSESSSLGHVPSNKKTISGTSLAVITNTMTGKNTAIPAAKLFADFVLVLALCHTVIIDTENSSGNSDTASGSQQQQQQQQQLVSESPDEEALVKAAQTLGLTFAGRSPGRVNLIQQTSSSSTTTSSSSSSSSSSGGTSVSYELLATIPFDSTRKRMSVVVRRPDGSIVVYCKGADNIIFERATHFFNAHSQIVALQDSSTPKDEMLSHLDCFASDGLRTLILAKKELTEVGYQEFTKLYSKAEKAIAGRDKQTAEAALLIESGLTVLGATAIEDKLQQGVPNTIADIRAAGIKLWVLTGDKMETAINIGYSSRLLLPNMILIKLAYKGEDAATMRKKLVSLLGHFQKMAENKFDLLRALSDIQHTITNSIFGMLNIKSDSSRDAVNSESDGETGSSSSRANKWVHESVERPAMEADENKPLLDESNDRPLLSQLTSDHLGLIVDGDTLIRIFGDAVSERIFLSLAMICRSVIACRVSPEQKRLIVRLVKKGIHPTPVTLSIGDGANDVAMIQEAQIGVGISGKEGRQAVNNSDFAIAQFRFLKRLLMVHGRLDYRRICKVVVYSFYKNIVLTMILFAFQFFAGYSGQSLFDDYIYAMYNIVLALPVIAFGIFDRDISEHTLLKYNFLYLNGRKRLDLNPTVVVLMILQAIVEAVIIFFVPYYCYSTQYDIWNSGTNGGYSEGLWVFGTAVYTYLIVSMFVRCGMLTYTWTWVTHVCMWGSLLLYFVFLLVYQYLSDWAYDFYGVANETFNSSTFWLLFLVVLAGSMLLDSTIDMIRREFFPSIVDIGVEFDRHAARQMKEGPLEYDCNTNSLLEPSIFGDSRAVRSRQSSRGHLSDHEGQSHQQPSSPSAAGAASPSDLTAEEQAALQFSKALSGPNDKQKFALDWFTLKSMFGTLSPTEAESLGVTNTENANQPGASYNYDHVSTGYGPGAGLNYIQNTIQKATNSVFRISGSDRSDVDNDENKSDIL